MARNIQSLIAKNRSTRREQLGFVEALDPLIKSSNINSLLLNDISIKLDSVSDNTKSFELIGNTIKTLASVMGTFVDVFSKDIDQRRTSAFFSGALAKENEYEKGLDKKPIDTSTAPTKEITKKSESGFLGTLLKWIGGLLIAGGIGNWLWKNQDFRTKVTGFIGKLFEGIGNGAESFYTFAKDWINDEKNKEKISNFFAGLLNAVAKGFELVGDLSRVLLEEYQREGSPLRNTINSIMESIWGFIKEHPVIALGAALVAFGDSLAKLSIGLFAASKTISLLAGTLSSPLGLGALAFGGGYLAGNALGEAITEKGKEIAEEKLTEDEQKEYEKLNLRLKNLRKNDPKLAEEIENEKEELLKRSMERTDKYNSSQAMERLNFSVLKHLMNKNEVIKSEGKVAAESANRTAAPAQPKLTTSPTQSNSLDAYRSDQIDIIDEQFKKLDSNYAEEKRNKDLTKLILNNSENSPTQTTPETKPSTKPEKVKEKSNKKGSTLAENGKAFLNKMLDDRNITDKKVRLAAFAIAEQESHFDMNARGDIIKDPKSKHYGDRAHGMFQIMPNTFSGMAKYNGKNIENNEISAQAGLDYFLENYKKSGNIQHAIASHYVGPGRADKWLAGDKSALNVSYGGVSGYDYLAQVNKRMANNENGYSINGTYDGSGNNTGSLIAKNTESTNTPEATSIFEPFSSGWLENIVDKVTATGKYGMTIDKLRSMSLSEINAPPKILGSEIERASREVKSAQNKAPEVVINAPTVTNNSTSGGNNANKEVQMASIFDAEFIEKLVGRTVDLFSFGSYGT